MNKLLQLSSSLIGSEESVLSVSKADYARLLVISDSHGAKNLLFRIIEDFGNQSDVLIFCGDGNSDLFTILDDAYNNPSHAMCIPRVIATVQGNNDSDRYPVEFKPHSETDESFYHEVSVPKSMMFSVCGHNVFVTHGHMDSVYYSIDMLEKKARKLKADLVFYGHTHIAERTEDSAAFLLNPGSCSLPRGGLPPSFAVVDVLSGENNSTAAFYKIEIFGNSVNYAPFVPKSSRLWW